MSSGVAVDEACIEEFNTMKIPGQNKPKRNRCIIYKISDNKKKIEIDEIVPMDPAKDQETEYNEIIKRLPTDQGRYIVWDLKVVKDGTTTENDKLIFMSWCHDTANINNKMIFAASKDAIKKKLVGIGTYVDCSDYSDAEYKTVLAKVGH